MEDQFNSAPGGKVGEFRVSKQVTDVEVNKELKSIWDLIRKDKDLREAAEEELGVGPLDSMAEPPFRAARPEGQFGVAETIIISVASGLLTHAIERLWERVVWPRLKRHFGADLEPTAGN